GKSNGVRLYLTQQALAGLRESPLIGFGSTRNTQGGRNSITVGESDDCERCGNFTVGGNGQLWQLLYAHGVLGTAAYLGFFGYGLWRFRRDASALGLVGSAALVSTFASMFWYNALVTPLAGAAVRRYGQPQTRLARLKRNAVVAALRTGVSFLLLRDRVRVTGSETPDTFERYLARALGPGLSLSVHIGPARANRKPVL